jgi:hypothetical protein
MEGVAEGRRNEEHAGEGQAAVACLVVRPRRPRVPPCAPWEAAQASSCCHRLLPAAAARALGGRASRLLPPLARFPTWRGGIVRVLG